MNTKIYPPWLLGNKPQSVPENTMNKKNLNNKMKAIKIFVVLLLLCLGGLIKADHINGAITDIRATVKITSQTSSYDITDGYVTFIIKTSDEARADRRQIITQFDITNVDESTIEVTVNGQSKFTNYSNATRPSNKFAFFENAGSKENTFVIRAKVLDRKQYVELKDFQFQRAYGLTATAVYGIVTKSPYINIVAYGGKGTDSKPFINTIEVYSPVVQSANKVVYRGANYTISTTATDPGTMSINGVLYDNDGRIVSATTNLPGVSPNTLNNINQKTVTLNFSGKMPLTEATGVRDFTITATDNSNEKGIGTVTLDIRPQNEAYEPLAKAEGVVKSPLGVRPEPQTLLNSVNLVVASSGLPNDTSQIKSYTFVGTQPDVSTPGRKYATVRVTYLDNSYDDVNVSFDIASAADQYDPQGKTLTIYRKVGTIPSAEDFVDKTGLPTSGVSYTWSTPITDKETAGTKTGTVKVSYQDGTSDYVNVNLNVIEPYTKKTIVILKGEDLNQGADSYISDQFFAFAEPTLNGYTPTTGWKTAPGVVLESKTIPVYVFFKKGTETLWEEVQVNVEVVTPPLQGTAVVGVGTSNADAKTKIKNEGAIITTNWAKGDVVDDTVPSTAVVADFIQRDEYHATGNGATIYLTYTETPSSPKYVLASSNNKIYKGVEYSNNGSSFTIDTEMVVAVRVVDTTRPVPPTYPNVWVIKDVPLDYTLPQATDNVGVTTISLVSYDATKSGILNVGGLYANVDNGTQKLVGTAGNVAEGQYQRRMEVGDEAGNTAKSERFSIYIVGITSSGITKNAGETVSEQEIKDKVVITAGNQTANIPSGEFVKEIISVNGVAYNGSNLPTSGNNIVKVKITNPTTGQVKIVDVPVNFNQNQADTYEPIGQIVKTPKGTLPEAKGSIFNTSELPNDAKYTWETEPDVSSVGLKDAVVKVVYTDGSFDLVPVKVFVYENETITNTRLEVSPTGKVGINTDKPQAMLDVRFVPNQENTNKAFELKNANGDKVLTLTKDGNLGFNTENPTAKLHIKGTMSEENSDASLMVLRNISGANRSNDNLSGVLKFVNENDKVYGAIATKPSELGLVGHSDKGLSAVMKAENGTDYSQIITKANGVNRIIFEVKTSNGTYKTLVDENNHWRLGGNNLNENESIKERIVIEGAVRVGSEASATAGTIRYNDGNLEVHNGTAWVQVNND